MLNLVIFCPVCLPLLFLHLVLSVWPSLLRFQDLSNPSQDIRLKSGASHHLLALVLSSPHIQRLLTYLPHGIALYVCFLYLILPLECEIRFCPGQPDKGHSINRRRGVSHCFLTYLTLNIINVLFFLQADKLLRALKAHLNPEIRKENKNQVSNGLYQLLASKMLCFVKKQLILNS